VETEVAVAVAGTSSSAQFASSFEAASCYETKGSINRSYYNSSGSATAGRGSSQANFSSPTMTGRQAEAVGIQTAGCPGRMSWSLRGNLALGCPTAVNLFVANSEIRQALILNINLGRIAAAALEWRLAAA